MGLRSKSRNTQAASAQNRTVPEKTDGWLGQAKKSFRHSDLGVIFVAIKLALRPGFSPAAACRAWLPPLRSGVNWLTSGTAAGCWRVVEWQWSVATGRSVAMVSGQVVWSRVDVSMVLTISG